MSYGPPALDHLSKHQISLYHSWNNQQSQIINIILASFARSVRQVMDPRFFLAGFHGKRKEQNSVQNLPRVIYAK